MRKVIGITCTDCAAPHEVTRRDAKYCPRCSVLRILIYARTKYKRQRTCSSCRKKYRAARAPDNSLCGPCHVEFIDPEDSRNQVGECRLCRKFRPLLHPAVPSCIICLKNPETQDLIVAGLKKGRDKRRSEFNWDYPSSPLAADTAEVV